MSHRASNRGAARLSPSKLITADLLWHHVEITVEDPGARPAFDLIQIGARQDIHTEAHARLDVTGTHGRYDIADHGDHLATASDPAEAAALVFERVNRRIFELASLKGWLRIHGAVLTCGGRRFGAVGPSGSGKTTLALAAVCVGLDVEADESFLIRGSDAIAVPRRFHAEAGTIERLPAIRDWAERSPQLSLDPPVWALDQTEFARSWRTRQAPLDGLVIITDNQTPPGLHRMTVPEALSELRWHALPTIEARSTVAANLAALLHRVPVFRLGGGHDVTPEAKLMILADAPLGR